MSNRLYYSILGLIALIGIIGLLKVSHSMNTLAEDATFMENVQVLNEQDRLRGFK